MTKIVFKYAKSLVNLMSKLDRYLIPKVDDLFSQLSGGKYFTKLDVRNAYQQVPLKEESKKYVVVNTHRGFFQYTRLPFGVSSVPGIFRRVIEGLLQGIEGVVVYLDDSLITGSMEEKHLKTLDEVLSHLDKAGLQVKRRKCESLSPTWAIASMQLVYILFETKSELSRKPQSRPL